MDNDLDILILHADNLEEIAEITEKTKERKKVIIVIGMRDMEITCQTQRKELVEAFKNTTTSIQVFFSEEKLIEIEREMVITYSRYLSPIGGLYEEELKLIKKGFDAQKRQFYFSETTKEKQNLTESLKIQNKKIFKKARSLIT